jgi:hypothetical protein
MPGIDALLTIAPPLRAQRADLVLHAEKHPGQVHGENALPGVLGILRRSGERSLDAGVVEGDVEPTESLDDVIHHRAHRHERTRAR